MYTGHNKFLISKNEKSSSIQQVAFFQNMQKDILGVIFGFFEDKKVLTYRQLSKQIRTVIDKKFSVYQIIAMKLATDEKFWQFKIKKEFSQITEEDFEKFIIANKTSIAELITQTYLLETTSKKAGRQYFNSLMKILESGYDGLVSKIPSSAIKYVLYRNIFYSHTDESSVWNEITHLEVDKRVVLELLTLAKQSKNETILNQMKNILQILAQLTRKVIVINKLLTNFEDPTADVEASIIIKM